MHLRGEITAFLTMIFAVFLSFVLAVTQVASIQVSKNRARVYADRGVFSAFGEYQKELMEDYGVFAIEGGYETGSYSEQNLLNRIAYYGDEGISQSVDQIRLLTDNNGQAFREQVMKYMETQTGISLLRNITSIASEWEELEIQGEALNESLNSFIYDADEYLPEGEQAMLPSVYTSLLYQVLPYGFDLSSKTIDLSSAVSHRELRVGRGSFPSNTSVGGIEERLLYNAYLDQKFSSAVTSVGHDRSLDYELEYILCGKNSDVQNLSSVVNRLVFFRMAMNFLCLEFNAALRSEAESLALAISAIMLMPEIAEPLTQFILLLWSYRESISDVQRLLAGGGIPIYKSEITWNTGIGQVFFPWGGVEVGSVNSDTSLGLNYNQYLQILLLIKEQESVTMRTLDRIEQNLITEKDKTSFRADYCIAAVKIQNSVSIAGGFTYEFPVSFMYQ